MLLDNRALSVHPLFVHPHAFEVGFSVRNKIEERVQKEDMRRWSEQPDPQQTLPPLPDRPKMRGAPLFAFVKGLLP